MKTSLRCLVAGATLACAPALWAADPQNQANQSNQSNQPNIANSDLEAVFGNVDMGKLPGPCKQINPTDDQKTAIGALMTDVKTQMQPLHEKFVTAHTAYVQLIGDANATLADADAQMAEMNAAGSGMMSVKGAAVNKVLFEILTPDQRGPAAKCMVIMMRHAHRHGGHRPAPQPAPAPAPAP